MNARPAAWSRPDAAPAASGRPAATLARRGLRLVLGLCLVAATLFILWGAAALHFAGPRPQQLADALAVTWLVAAVVALARARHSRLALAALVMGAVVLLAWWTSLQPRNDRDWLPDVARPPTAEVNGNVLTVHDVRNFEYRSEEDYTPHWDTRTYDLARLDGLDLFMSYWGSPSIAHTILSWSFDDGQHFAVSIETRKERGETYSAVAGFFKQYELYYVAADERDVVRLRTNYRHEQVYLYPLRTPLERARAALLQYVRAMNELAARPQFYDAATQNCTTTIRTNVQHIGVAAPFDWRFYLNGYADEMLYERGRIDTSRPFAEVKASSLVNARAEAANDDPAFSQRIREGIVRPAPLETS